jgi:hypothetical protein
MDENAEEIEVAEEIDASRVIERTFAPIESDRYMRHVAFVRRKRRARRRTEDDEA